MEDFDPNGTGIDNGNYFGLPFTPASSRLVLLSVPWDVTASYGGGTCYAPDAIIGASMQLDLMDVHNPNGWRRGIGTIDIDYQIQDDSIRLRDDARKVMAYLEGGGKVTDDSVKRKIERVNTASQELNKYVYTQAKEWLEKDKIVALVGGDHSTPLGLIRAVAEREGEIGVLHIDAHADLRECYEGFTYSHASIMYNVINSIEGVTKLVQVGIRDLCDSEYQLAQSNPKIEMIDDYTLARNRFCGVTWQAQCREIVAKLPQNVYVSFDIDGLSPDNCPNTGTPVAGGLSFHEAVYLLNEVVESGRRIVGFDLCEVSPAKDSEWDANVGARILYKLCNLTLKNN